MAADIGSMYDAAVNLRRLLLKGVGVAPRPGPDGTVLQAALDRLITEVDALMASVATIPGTTRIKTEGATVAESTSRLFLSVRAHAAPAQAVGVADAATAHLAP